MRNYLYNIIPINIITLLIGSTTNAPPPATSVTMATNFGLAAQKLES